MTSHELQENTEFLPPALWDGNVFDGAWTPAASPPPSPNRPTVPPLGSVGTVDATGIADAAKSAGAAQGDWVATSYEQRAAVLRAAARIAEEHAAEIVDWLVRKAGSIRIKAEFAASRVNAGRSWSRSRMTGQLSRTALAAWIRIRPPRRRSPGGWKNASLF